MVRIDDVLPYLQSSHWGTYAFNVTLPDGRTETALIRDLQVDPLSREILHVDFYQLLKGHKVLVAVPVVLENRDDCIGVKKAGFWFNHCTRLRWKCYLARYPMGYMWMSLRLI